jgi:hypothetical protein
MHPLALQLADPGRKEEAAGRNAAPEAEDENLEGPTARTQLFRSGMNIFCVCVCLRVGGGWGLAGAGSASVVLSSAPQPRAGPNPPKAH